MKIDAVTSIQAMTALQKGEILQIQKKNGKTSLVTIKKGNLTFCQRFWKWLGCGGASFKRVLKVIQQIQKEHKTQLDGKDFTTLKGKIKKYKPLFGSKVKKTVWKLLPKAPAKVTPPPAPKEVQPLSQKQCEQFLEMFTKGKVTDLMNQLTKEQHQLQFDQFIYEILMDDARCNESIWEPFEKTFSSIQDGYDLLRSLNDIEAPWAHTLLYFLSLVDNEESRRIVNYTLFESIQKQCEIIEKNHTSPIQKEERIKEILTNLLKIEKKDENTQTTIKRLLKIVKTTSKIEGLHALETFTSFILEKNPKFEEKAAYTFESFLLSLKSETNKHWYDNPTWSVIAKKAQNLDLSGDPTKLERWKVLLRDLLIAKEPWSKAAHGLNFSDYIDRLDPYKKAERQLLILVRKELHDLLVYKAKDRSYSFYSTEDRLESPYDWFQVFFHNNNELAKLDAAAAQEIRESFRKILLDEFIDASKAHYTDLEQTLGKKVRPVASKHFDSEAPYRKSPHFWNALKLGSIDAVKHVLHGTIIVRGGSERFIELAEKIPGIPGCLSTELVKNFQHLKEHGYLPGKLDWIT